jgi:hypothetical protein
MIHRLRQGEGPTQCPVDYLVTELTHTGVTLIKSIEIDVFGGTLSQEGAPLGRMRTIEMAVPALFPVPPETLIYLVTVFSLISRGSPDGSLTIVHVPLQSLGPENFTLTCVAFFVSDLFVLTRLRSLAHSLFTGST